MPVTVNDILLEKLKTGVILINDQHKKIFDFTTDLFSHCVGDEDEENRYFAGTIGGAVELVKTHFKTEEDLMMETNFPVFEFKEHKKEHDEFIYTVSDYISQFKKNGSVNLLMFASYAKWWVIGHIKHHDRKYISFFNKITEGRNIERMTV